MSSDDEYEAKRRELINRYNKALNSKPTDYSELRSIGDELNKHGVSFRLRKAKKEDKV
jgi:hypothetical protein